jgi:DNA-binding SARP family transcriptional activator
VVVAAAGKEGSQPIQMQPILRLYAFGEGRVLRGDRVITNAEWGMAKAKELLFYLLCHRQRRKDQIGTDLWPELSPARLRSSFHVALYRLRRALGQQDCVVYEGDQYFFNRRIHYWFDVEEFEKSIDRAESLWSDDCVRAAQHYNEAVVLYRGDLLEDMQTGHDWALLKMEGLLRKHLSALQRLGQYHAERGDYRQAIGFYEQVLGKDAYQESAHREVMRCQALLGRRSAALKCYHRLARLLEEELGVAPAPETTRLYEQILQNRISAT